MWSHRFCQTREPVCPALRQQNRKGQRVEVWKKWPVSWFLNFKRVGADFDYIYLRCQGRKSYFYIPVAERCNFAVVLYAIYVIYRYISNARFVLYYDISIFIQSYIFAICIDKFDWWGTTNCIFTWLKSKVRLFMVILLSAKDISGLSENGIIMRVPLFSHRITLSNAKPDRAIDIAMMQITDFKVLSFMFKFEG